MLSSLPSLIKTVLIGILALGVVVPTLKKLIANVPGIQHIPTQYVGIILAIFCIWAWVNRRSLLFRGKMALCRHIGLVVLGIGFFLFGWPWLEQFLQSNPYLNKMPVGYVALICAVLLFLLWQSRRFLFCTQSGLVLLGLGTTFTACIVLLWRFGPEYWPLMLIATGLADVMYTVARVVAIQKESRQKTETETSGKLPYYKKYLDFWWSWVGKLSQDYRRQCSAPVEIRGGLVNVLFRLLAWLCLVGHAVLLGAEGLLIGAVLAVFSLLYLLLVAIPLYLFAWVMNKLASGMCPICGKEMDIVCTKFQNEAYYWHFKDDLGQDNFRKLDPTLAFPLRKYVFDSRKKWTSVSTLMCQHDCCCYECLREGNTAEAPKVVKGYQGRLLVSDFARYAETDAELLTRRIGMEQGKTVSIYENEIVLQAAKKLPGTFEIIHRIHWFSKRTFLFTSTPDKYSEIPLIAQIVILPCKRVDAEEVSSVLKDELPAYLLVDCDREQMTEYNRIQKSSDKKSWFEKHMGLRMDQWADIRGFHSGQNLCGLLEHAIREVENARM